MPDLAELLAARTEALARPRRQVPWSTLTPARRAEEQKTLRDVANAERAILAVLLASPGPVRVGDVVLHLTWDRLNFVELDRATGEPVWTSPTSLIQSGWRHWLYRYPARQAAS
jgi:hypothetical protein